MDGDYILDSCLETLTIMDAAKLTCFFGGDIDPLDYVTGIGNSSREQLAAIHYRADNPCLIRQEMALYCSTRVYEGGVAAVRQ